MTNNRRQRTQRAEQARLERERAEKRRRSLLTAGVIIAVIALIAIAAVAVRLSQGGDGDGPLVKPQALTANGSVVYDQQAAIGKSAGEATPIDVVLFVDYQCPICKIFEENVGDFLDQQVDAGAVSIEYRPVSFLDDMSSTDYSSRALGAAMCVNEGKGAKAFKDFSDLLFVNQPKEGSDGLPDSRLGAYAEQAGAPETKACITKRTYQTWAKSTGDKMSDVQDSAGNALTGTPAIWVDGRAVEGPKQDGEPTMARVQDIEMALAAAQS